MITIRKLRTLKKATLRRKTAVMLQAFEQDLLADKKPDSRYFSEFLEIVAEEFSESEAVVNKAAAAADCSLRAVNSLRHEILKFLGSEPADWDMFDLSSPEEGTPNGTSPGGCKAGMHLFLDDIRSPFNIGSIFRTAEAFGLKKIFLSPDCPSPEHPRAQRTAMGCTRIVNWEYIEKENLFQRPELNGHIFALELGGCQIQEFIFPEYGLAIIGSEELGISPESRKASAGGLGIVTIPVYGIKGSINVSAAAAVMMQRWAEKVC